MKDFDLIISNLPTSANYKVEELAKQGFLAERGGCFRGFGHPGRSLGLLHPSVFCLVFVWPVFLFSCSCLLLADLGSFGLVFFLNK